jgi:hypothetical protein
MAALPDGRIVIDAVRGGRIQVVVVEGAKDRSFVPDAEHNLVGSTEPSDPRVVVSPAGVALVDGDAVLSLR